MQVEPEKDDAADDEGAKHQQMAERRQ